MVQSNTETNCQRAADALHHSPVFALRHLQVEVEGDCLLISGRVNSFYHKQLAQEAVLAVAGESRLVNSIDVSGGTEQSLR